MKTNIPHLPNLSSALTRRAFLRAALVTGGALALPGCGNSASPAETAPSETSGQSSAVTSTLSPAPPEYLPRIDGGVTAVSLPAPRLEGGLPLMQALARRASHRAYASDEIPLQVLSDLLWAAFGVNRPSSGLRTAPSAVNVQDIDIYLAAGKGVFRFDARPHALQAVLPGDLRPLTGMQISSSQGLVSLIYVSDYEKLRLLRSGDFGEESDAVWSWTHTGFISQNVYLFCASEGLATVVRAIFNRDSLTERMGLPESKRITLVQTVGYPA